MSLTFLPSLQHLAAVRVALAAYNDDTVRLLDELILKEKATARYKLIPNEDDDDRIEMIQIEEDNSEDCFYKQQEKWIRKSKKKARKKLSKLLPKLLQKRVVHILQPLATEIYFWVRDHWYIIKHIERGHFTNNLCWKSEGTIDRTKTAKQLVRNESIGKRVRFAMACIYFWENDVLHLWHSMTTAERKSIFSINSNVAVHFWMKWLRKRARPPWTQLVSNYMDSDVLKLDYNRVRLSSFFIELNTFSQGVFLRGLWPQHAHIDDLRLCYNLLDETGRSEIFHSQSKTSQVLCCYLDWPLQSLFLDAVNQVRSHLTAFSFEYLLYKIVHKKLMRGMQDFDYLQLLKDLWNRIPDPYKVEIQRQRDFTLVRAAMCYDEETHPLPIQKLLKKCSEFTNELVFEKIRSLL
ncbi:hypothetical protein AVEN_74807-1 [Araneus ventricosus]|uniref:SOCS box domain-containing protein n=1 Tax=Araneus ventricosus TaxID=182803 RepID=A0A4Y2HPK5_ARAVE|nr:hypothetical protein AVEN_74807-1 [Araneus ventricosus]